MKTSVDSTIHDQDIFCCINSGIIATDTLGIIKHLNHQGEIKLDITAKDYIGKDIGEIHPLFHSLIMDCLESREAVQCRQISIGQRELLIDVNPITHSGGHLIRCCLQFSGD